MSFYTLKTLPTVLSSLSKSENLSPESKILQAIEVLEIFKTYLDSLSEKEKETLPIWSVAPQFLYGLMDYAPLEYARTKMAEIIGAAAQHGNAELLNLARYFYHNLDLEQIARSLTPGKQSNVKVTARKRDRNRCLITGIHDVTTFPFDSEEIESNPQCDAFPTEVAHIMPFSLVDFSKTQYTNDDAAITKMRDPLFI
ncbi:hypothetical protein FRC17_002626 [Serendipita sp. 399]|nr:hypothetical protein FRC17_002626 [Serendipita sp. 399]